MRMLIADDHRQIVSILTEYAKNEGFEVVTAGDGETALQEAKISPFDMVLFI